jgi:hypothetical protein
MTHQDGDFNSENPCGNLNTVVPPATVTPGIASTCLLASFNTDGHQQGDTLTATASTPVCPAANGTAPVVDADIHDTCVAGDGSVVPPFTVGSLANLLNTGALHSFSVTIPEDRIV